MEKVVHTKTRFFRKKQVVEDEGPLLRKVDPFGEIGTRSDKVMGLSQKFNQA